MLDLLEPSDYDIFSPADACPDNNQVTPDGVRLLDFEFAGCYSLFIDAACTVTPFPTLLVRAGYARCGDRRAS